MITVPKDTHAIMEGQKEGHSGVGKEIKDV